MQNQRKDQLEQFLRTTHADQGGEATFSEFVSYVAEDETEIGHQEAKQYLLLGGEDNMKYLFHIEGLEREVWQAGNSEKGARKALWASLSTAEQERVVQIECIDQSANDPHPSNNIQQSTTEENLS